MRRSSWLILLVVVVLIGALLATRSASRPKPTDRMLILALMQKGELAGENKDLKGMTSCLSPDYSDAGGLDFDAMRLHLIQVVRAEGRYEVQVEYPRIAINGDRARVETTVSVALSDGGGGNQYRAFAGPVVLTLAREHTKRLLVLPTRVWRVVSIDGLPGEFSD